MATADSTTYYFRALRLEWIFRNAVPPWEQPAAGFFPYAWPFTQFKGALHQSSPGTAGGLGTNPATYSGYLQINIPRAAASWVIVGSGGASPYVYNAVAVLWPVNGGGNQTETHASLGYDNAGTPVALAFTALEGGSLLVRGGASPMLPIGGLVFYGKNKADS